ncbi:MAG: hypothetical protein ABI758_05910 [Candidatus Woesebacteria bacterium]
MSLLNELPTRERMEKVLALYHNEWLIGELEKEFPLLSLFASEIRVHEEGQLGSVSQTLLFEAMKKDLPDEDLVKVGDEAEAFSSDSDQNIHEGIKRAGEVQQNPVLMQELRDWENQLKTIFFRLVVRL